jgi:hypothetical protein
MRMAKDIGVTPSQLQELVCKGPDSANLLKRMLVALHVDPKIIADMDPLVVREMKWGILGIDSDGCASPVTTRSDVSMNLPRAQPPSIFTNFAQMPFRSTSSSVRKSKRHHTKGALCAHIAMSALGGQ